MRERLIIAAILLALLPAAFCAGCVCCGDAPPTPEPVLTGQTAGFRWAILPTESGNAFRADWAPHFLPDAAVVRSALAGVQAHVRDQMQVELDPKFRSTKTWRKMLTGVIEKFAHYRCQVIGFTHDDGRAFLYLNFVHEEDFEANAAAGPEYETDWTQELELVDGGGDWFWQVQYIPATGAFESLNINGES